MASRVQYKQDLPPKEGYPEIRTARNLPRRGPSGTMMFLGGAAIMAFGLYMLGRTNRERRAERKEQLNARLILLPLLQAEHDRRVLRAMKSFEEEEAKIMEGVPDWNVGESVYHTEKWVPPHPVLLKDF